MRASAPPQSLIGLALALLAHLCPTTGLAAPGSAAGLEPRRAAPGGAGPGNLADKVDVQTAPVPEADTFALGVTSTAAPLQLGPADTTSSTAPMGLTLPQLVDEALKHNLKVRIDEARIGEARALYSLAAAQAYPRFGANAILGGPTPEHKTRVVNDLNTVTPASYLGTLDFGQLGFTFRFDAEGALPLYTFGKISNAKAAATQAVEAAGEKKVVTEAEVVLDVYRAFWAYQLTHAYIASIRDGEATLEKVLAKIEDLIEHDSDQVTESDRLRLVHAVATVRVRRSEAEEASDLSLAALKLLIGRGQDAGLEVATAELDELPPTIPEVRDMVRDAQERRPEVLALRHVVGATSKYADLRRSMLLPDLYLGGVFNYAYTSNATDQTNPFIYDPYNYLTAGVGVGVRFELDVFNKLAQLEQAEAAVATHAAETAAVEQAVDLEVRKIHHDLTSGYARIELLERANRAARSWLTSSTLAYDIGAGDARQLIDAFLAWAASQAELEKTRYDMHVAHADLARAAGRLIPRPNQQN